MPSYKNPLKRGLTAMEITALPRGLVATVSIGDVTLVAAHHPMSRMSRIVGHGTLIVVRGQRIFWPNLPKDLSHDPAMLAILAHELVHVWQYAHGMTLWRYLWRERGIYRYRLKPGKSYTAYGYEQQAAMVEDWVRLSHGITTRWSRDTITAETLETILPFA